MPTSDIPAESIVAFRDFFRGRSWEPFPFQEKMLRRYLGGYSGILNAPTGTGKTLAMWLPILIDWMQRQPDYAERKNNGLRVLWITPLRALAKDAVNAMEEALIELDVPWRVQLRTGDTKSAERQKQKKNMPECLVTTPESLHVLFASKDHEKLFENLEVMVVDEWHALLGGKRGVQLELGAAHLKRLAPRFKIWGISATIGNLHEALEVLMGGDIEQRKTDIVRAEIEKKIAVESVLPEDVERFPWSGHLGLTIRAQVIPLIEQSNSTLLFCNTRRQAEAWYQALLADRPDWAGIIALHHGSLSGETRAWVEEALHAGQLKLVVATSSLDLGVDFRPVETVIQVGGPKGIARFVQRAGRSGHRPGEISRVYFVPTNTLELIEAAALKRAVAEGLIESRSPLVLTYDVLVQYLVTLAVGGGFYPDQILAEVQNTFAFAGLDEGEFRWMLTFITSGGKSLAAYEEYQKVEVEEDGRYVVNSRKVATRHRLGMGTIVSDEQLKVKFMRGGYIGTVEESFLSSLEKGDNFWFAGRNLELVRIRNNEALVRRSRKKTGKIPAWNGARLPLSTQMSQLLRDELDHFVKYGANEASAEIQHLVPLLNLQARWSKIPSHDIFLIERLNSREGNHLFFYPFEGRIIHEMLGALFAYRIGQLGPISFSIAMNDYGFELLSDQEIPLKEAMEAGIFSPQNLARDLERSVNETMMAQKKFHEIAFIAGLMFRGYPGRPNSNRHLHATSGLLFKVFQEYDPHNLLLRQAYSEVIDYQIDDARLYAALQRIADQQIEIVTLKRSTPFAFPILVDRLRERLSSEKLADRIRRMHLQLDAAAEK